MSQMKLKNNPVGGMSINSRRVKLNLIGKEVKIPKTLVEEIIARELSKTCP